jgi:hypothetical protein
MVASRFAACIAAAIALAACASAPSPSEPRPAPVPAPPHTPSPPVAQEVSAPRFRCDHDIEFTVHFGDGTAQIDAGPQGSETLLRDAGGVTPQQTVYSSTRLKAEFGLGPGGDEAVLHYAAPPLEVHCTKG